MTANNGVSGEEDEASRASEQSPSDPATLTDVRPFLLYDIEPPDPKQSRNLSRASYWVMTLGLFASVVIAVIGASQTALVSAMLALVAAGAQVVSVLLSQQSGKPDANHVRTLARRAQKHAVRLDRAVFETDALLSTSEDMPHEVRQRLGVLVLQLEVTREELGETVETWRDLNPALFNTRSDS